MRGIPERGYKYIPIYISHRPIASARTSVFQMFRTFYDDPSLSSSSCKNSKFEKFFFLLPALSERWWQEGGLVKKNVRQETWKAVILKKGQYKQRNVE